MNSETSVINTCLFIIFLSLNLQAQLIFPFDVEVKVGQFNGAPGVHSFAWALNNVGEGLSISGRIDGLHQRQPFAAFLASDNNKFAYVLNPQTKEVWK